MKLLLLLVALPVLSQPLRLSQAVEQSLQQYPSLKINEAQVAAAAAGVQQARLAYLPKADAIAQVNRATRNNVYGMLLQQQVISPISGPPLAANAGTNVWGTAVGFLVSWEPFDFGRRYANTLVSETAQRRAEASLRRTRFEVAAMTAEAFLTVLAAQQALEAASSGRDRITAIAKAVRSQVDSGLRPGVDWSRTESERAAIENSVIQAEAALRIAEANLRQFLPPREGPFTLSPGNLLATPAPVSTSLILTPHPALAETAIARDESAARLRVIERSYYPRFATQGTLYARGTGANPDFTTGGAFSGLGPNIYNWGLGFTVTYSLMDLPGLRVRKEIESARGRAEQARYDQLARELNTQRERATAQESAAHRIAANTSIQLDAARAARTQAEARYRSGLSNITELADAERALTQAEIDYRLALLGIWRAQLAIAVAEGDLTDFLARAEHP
jgi:outer membrane protein TolC